MARESRHKSASRGNHHPLTASQEPRSPRREPGNGVSSPRWISATLVLPYFPSPLAWLFGELAMRIFLVGALIAGSLISFEAQAQERAGDAALGAVSGAVVLGPVGAVAGALIGYTAGPSIARSWGVRRSSSSSSSSPHPRVQRTSQTSAVPEPQTTASIPLSPPPVIRASPAPMATTKPPPVQGLE